MSITSQPTPNVDQLLKRRDQLLRKIAQADERTQQTQERLEWLQCLIEEEESPKKAAA